MTTAWYWLTSTFWTVIYLAQWALWLIFNAGMVIIVGVAVFYVWRRYAPTWAQSSIDPVANVAFQRMRVFVGERIAGAKIGSIKTIEKRLPGPKAPSVKQRFTRFVLRVVFYTGVLGYLVWARPDLLSTGLAWFLSNVISPPN